MKKFFLFFLQIVSFLLLSCSDNVDVDYDKVANYLQNQIKENKLLVSVLNENEQYIFCFETDSICIPAEYVENVKIDKENWETELKFIDGKTYIIPTIGSSMDNLILSITKNPSGRNPLSASVVVKLPVLGHIGIIVHTKRGSHTPDIEYTFKSVEVKQAVPILGLYQNYDNKVTLVYTDLNGKERSRIDLNITTEPFQDRRLPKDIRVTQADYELMEPGMNLINSPGMDETDTSIPYMVDADGEIRWVINWENTEHEHIGISCGLIRLQNGNFMTGDANNHRLVELDVLGNTIHNWDMLEKGYTMHHAISETSDGNILATVSKVTAKIASGKDVRVNDFIIVFDTKKGSVIKEWDLVNMLDSARYGMTKDDITPGAFSQNASNWAHNNGIVEWGDNYLATARYQGIFKFNKAGGIEWIISAHGYWRDKYRRMLLKPLHTDGTPITDQDVIDGITNCDDFEWPWGCHTAVPLPNGHIYFFNNGFGRNFKVDMNDEIFSCGMEYEVDEINRTVRQVWQYGRERGLEYFAPARSGIQYLEKTENRLVCPGMTNTLSNGGQGARVTEVDPRTQKVVFELELEDGIYHRAYRMPLYPDGM